MRFCVNAVRRPPCALADDAYVQPALQDRREELGPEPGKPVIVGAGMMGDRASVVFASPQEISPFIAPGC
jgi:hypothetical protein